MKIKRPVCKKEGIVSQDMGSEVLLRDEEGKVLHILNSTAKLIWLNCNGEHTIEDMEKLVRDNFAITDDHDVRGDILQILDVFQKKGILDDNDDNM